MPKTRLVRAAHTPLALPKELGPVLPQVVAYSILTKINEACSTAGEFYEGRTMFQTPGFGVRVQG